MPNTMLIEPSHLTVNRYVCFELRQGDEEFEVSAEHIVVEVAVVDLDVDAAAQWVDAFGTRAELKSALVLRSGDRERRFTAEQLRALLPEEES